MRFLLPPPASMHLPQYSLEYEYSLYVEQEIENYKESVPRSALLAIGDEAVAALALQPQLALNELVLCDEVDRIIKRRLRLPSFKTWRRRRLELLAKLRRPEHWGLEPNDALVRAIKPAEDSRVLVAGSATETPALYLAAHGCEVTAVDPHTDAIERVMSAAEAVGLVGRVHGCVSDLVRFSPDGLLTAVVCAPGAFTGLSMDERAGAISRLQSVTASGGVHLIRAIMAEQPAVSVDELRSRYQGWQISIERESDRDRTFLARKSMALAGVSN